MAVASPWELDDGLLLRIWEERLMRGASTVRRGSPPRGRECLGGGAGRGSLPGAGGRVGEMVTGDFRRAGRGLGVVGGGEGGQEMGRSE